MCNLYSITRSQDAMRRVFAVARDLTGNLRPLPDVFPDQLAPIVRIADGERQLEMMRWGMPGPPQFGGAPVTNIRNSNTAPRLAARRFCDRQVILQQTWSAARVWAAISAAREP